MHIVHKKYKQYIIRIHSRYSGTYDASVFYDIDSANEHLEICLINYPLALIEYHVTNWKNDVSKYDWYKHFIYSKSYSKSYSKPTKTKHFKLPIEHPLEQYLFRDTSFRYSRAEYDDDDLI